MKLLLLAPLALFLASDGCAPKHQTITCYDLNGKPYFTQDDVEVTTNSDGITLYKPGSAISIGFARGNCVVTPYTPPAEAK